MRFQVLILLLSVATTCIARASTFKIPLKRSIIEMGGHLGQPAVNYYAPVSIGTPQQRFNIQFDTNLNELFVPHREYRKLSPSLHYNKGYRGSDSGTSIKINKDEMSIDYQQCEMKGKPYQDVINFITAQPEVGEFEQQFLAIKRVKGQGDKEFKDLEVDGFFGLDPAPQSITSGSWSLLHSLRRAKLVAQLQFSFWFTDAHDSKYGGELIFGGVDTTRYSGQISWHPLSASAYDQWILNLQYVAVGPKAASSSGQAIISTGVSDTYGPQKDVDQIYAMLGVYFKKYQPLPRIDCERVTQLPDIVFAIDGVAYAWKPSQYVRLVDKSDCYVAVLPSREGSPNQWTLGSHFLSAYYSVFNMSTRKVGFATRA